MAEQGIFLTRLGMQRLTQSVLFVTEAWPNGTGPFDTLYRDYEAYFKDRGWIVNVCDNKRTYVPYWRKTVWEYPRGFGRLGVVRLNNILMNFAVRRAVQKHQPNLVIVTKGENLFEQTVSSIRRRPGTFLFNWNHDNPFWPGNTSDHHLRSIRWYHKYFNLGGFLVPALRSLGCEDPEALPCFYNESRMGPPRIGASLHERRGIVFIGLGNERRARALRPLVEHGLEIWGDWRLSSSDPLARAWKGRYLGGAEYSQVMGRARIVVNILNEQCIGLHNARVFEATGCGALLVTERSDDLEHRFFEGGREILCFQKFDQIASLIATIQANMSSYDAIRVGGYMRTIREHQLRNRLDMIAARYSELRDAIGSPCNP